MFVCPRICPRICQDGKKFQKIMASWNFRQIHLQEVGLIQIMGDHETLSIVHHVGLRVDFSSMKSSLDL